MKKIILFIVGFVSVFLITWLFWTGIAWIIYQILEYGFGVHCNFTVWGTGALFMCIRMLFNN